MGYAAALWIIGIVCLIGAVLGKVIRVGQTELPSLGQRRGRVLIALVGVVSLVLGSVAFLGTPLRDRLLGRSTSGASSATTLAYPTTTTTTSAATGTSAGSSVTSSAPSVSAAPLSPSTPQSVSAAPPTPGVFWSGTVGGLSNGIDFDVLPPRHVADLDITANGKELQGGTRVTLAEWVTNRAPGKDDCSQWLRDHGAAFVFSVVVGTQICARTAEGRLAYLRITKLGTSSSSETEADVVVWDTP